MKQYWELQGKATFGPDPKWIPLRRYRTRKNVQLNRVRRKAERLGMSAIYRAVLVRE